MTLDSIVDVSITTLTSSVARTSFDTPLLAAYFPTTIFPQRVKSYNRLSDMSEDGFPTSHPAYLMAQALKAQSPSIKTWKVGRRALPPVQTIRITPTITTAGEVLRITVEGTEVSYTILSGDSVATICTALAALLNGIVGVTAVDNTTHVTVTPNRLNSVRLTVDTATSSETYTVTINGVEYEYAADSATSATEIRDGLQALIDAGSAPVTVTDVSTNALDIVATDEVGFQLAEEATGTGAMSLSNSVSNYDLLSVASPSAGLTVKDNTPDPGIATDLAAIESEDAAFYGLLIDSESEAQILEAAEWVESRRLLFLPSSIDTELKDSLVTNDVASDLKTAGYNRTGLIFSESSQQYGGARWMGRMFPKDPGRATYAYKDLSGYNVTVLTGAEEAALNGKNCNHFQEVQGARITQKGYAASGEWLDITHGVDWFRARLQERIFSILVNNEKVSYNEAADLFRAAIQAQLLEGQGRGLIAPNTEDQPWVIEVPDGVDVEPADRALRDYPDINFSAYLQGAVHTVQIQGTLSS